MTAQSDTTSEALQLLKRHFGFDGFRPGQEEALRSVLDGRNVLAVMPTGSGKSLIYQLPALRDEGLTIVVSPLIALMKNQVDELAARGYPATFINSSLVHEQQMERIDACVAGKVKLLYVAPERFRVGSFMAMLERVRVSRLAVDEAHCISQWGHDFRPDYRRLKAFRKHLGEPPVTALTATATPRVQDDIIDSLGLHPDEVDVHVHGFDRPNLRLSVRQAATDREKIDWLTEFVAEQKGCGIVYVGTRKSAEEVAAELAQVEPATAPYHAGLMPDHRAKAQEDFLSGRIRVVVATIAFGMGIDKPDVRFVVHYAYPGSVEGYYQEIGRAGRDGLPSECVLLHSFKDHYLREFFIDLNYPGPDIVASVYDQLWRIDENPVLMIYEDLARLCGDGVKGGQVGSAVRLLDQAGLTRAAGETTVGIGFDRPGDELLAEVKGPIQRQVLEGLSASIDLEVPDWYEVPLAQICAGSGLNETQVRRALAALANAKLIQFEPPFRGRGILKLTSTPPPFEKLPIDWEHQAMLRGLEEEKLAIMEDLITTPECRRGYILRYFGEEPKGPCGTCDRCASRPAGAKSVLDAHPEIAVPVLACVGALRFPLGADNVAKIVTGSKEKQLLKWGAPENPAYNRVTAKREVVKDVIERLLQEGRLTRGGDSGRPVLELTSSGQDAAHAQPLAEVAAQAPKTVAMTAAADRLARDPEVRLAVLRCVKHPGLDCGVSGVAKLLTGSRAKWIAGGGFDELDLYNSVDASQKKMREVVRAMMSEGLLRSEAGAHYPIVRVTDRGQQELYRLEDQLAGEQPARPNADAAPIREPVRRPEPRAVPPVARQLDELIERLLIVHREEARELLTEVRLFHPDAIRERVEARFAAATDERTMQRAVWAAGELGGIGAIPFLVRCTQSDIYNVRRLAASALGKIGRREQPDTEVLLAQAREALEHLLNDEAVQVRQYAQKALSAMRTRGNEPGER